MRIFRSILLISVAAAGLRAQNFYNYVGQIEPRSVLLAWGTTAAGAGNTIGRDSTPIGNATVRIANRTLPATQNWLVVDGLTPDTTYPYEIDIDGQRRGGGQVRTWPEAATRVCFFAMGDYGNGSAGQQNVAAFMANEFRKRADGDCPIRFVLTLGDNIYADSNIAVAVRSGDLDSQWDRKFFAPYAPVLREIPFLPSLGGHDGNETEGRGDLFAYLDNFFFPQNKPARYYTFSFGGFAQFFALDTTTSTAIGPPVSNFAPGGAQFTWMKQVFADSKAPWKIPYFHNPVWNAGPRHPDYHDDLKHWVDLFEHSGVKVVLNGHEHNFQFTNAAETGGILYVISGSGGELRPGDVRRKMAREHMAGWAAYRQFLLVELNGDLATITPLSPEPLTVVDRNKHAVPMPVVQTLK